MTGGFWFLLLIDTDIGGRGFELNPEFRDPDGWTENEPVKGARFS
ncbi:MAG: hypothetical protein WCG76_03220 [Verrucomicrobiota bacterium]